MDRDFIICQVGWLSRTQGNEHRRDQIVDHFFEFMNFLQEHGLLVTTKMQSRNDLTDDFALRSGDLTDDGMAVVRLGYDKWLTKVDKGMSPTDWSVLEKALLKVRAT